MPLIADVRLSRAGAVIDVLIGPNPRRRALLRKLGFPTPDPVPVRAIIDTGASMSGFAAGVFRAADLSVVADTPVLTPSTPSDQPYVTSLYDVALYLVAGGKPHEFMNIRVMAAQGWHPEADDGAEGIIGRDVLDRAVFTYHGPAQAFSFGF